MKYWHIDKYWDYETFFNRRMDVLAEKNYYKSLNENAGYSNEVTFVLFNRVLEKLEFGEVK